MSKRLVALLAVAVAVVLVGVGAVVLVGGSSAAPALKERIDPKDPTPGTPGRMTAREERAIGDCVNYVQDTIESGRSTYQLLPEESQNYMVDELSSGCFRSKGIDPEDIKRRNDEAKAEGFG